MSDADTDNHVMSLAREPCVSATTTATTIKMAGITAAADDCLEAEKSSVAPGGGGDADEDEADENQSTSRQYSLADYLDTRIDCSTGGLRDAFTCPRGGDTQCDGFVFASLDECRAHERDWHAGPYRCLVCGQAFGSGPRLRRHAHHAESESRRSEVGAAEARRAGGAAVRVYHGNGAAQSRARRLARMVRAEGLERDRARGMARKKAERTARQARRNKGGEMRDDHALVVIGAAAGGVEEEGGGGGGGGAEACEEACCPFFEKTFASRSAYERHVAAQGHVVAVAMGEALTKQITTMVMARASTTVKDADQHIRACTPPPQRALQLLTPPATPTTGDEGLEPATSAWDDEEALPMILERRLNKTRCALRELRCNAPGCSMYGRKMATSQSYWSHLASAQHTAALKAWRERGGEAVYVSA